MKYAIEVHVRRTVCVIAMAATMTTWTSVHAETTDGVVVLKERGEETIFNYRAGRGPDRWAELDDAWSACGEGESQSPIDISGATVRNLRDPVFDYGPSSIEVLNNGHTVEFVYDQGSTLRIGRSVYEVAQFHFHTPSEHSFGNGAHFPVEMHIVHTDPVGRIAVVGVMLREGARNRALPNARRWGQMLPREEGIVYQLHETIDLGALLPVDRRTYRYSGSLTTPPCSEEVRWFVMAQPIEASRSQLKELREALNQLKFASSTGTNNRPTQPLNGRRVHLDRRAD